jgi:RNA polymerase sigma factor (sigma-70 family)
MTVVEDDAAAIRSSLNDPAAFRDVFDRHFHAVHRFASRRVGSAYADDIAAETFVRAFEHRARYRRERESALPWLLGIAVNLLGRHYRDEERQLRAYARTGVDPVLDTADVSDARLDAEGSRRRLAEALAELRPEERDVLLLFAWAELDYAEIAEALEVPIGTVRSRLSRAREHVRAVLATRPEPEVTGERA